jgi:hypothetical protein
MLPLQMMLTAAASARLQTTTQHSPPTAQHSTAHQPAQPTNSTAQPINTHKVHRKGSSQAPQASWRAGPCCEHHPPTLSMLASPVRCAAPGRLSPLASVKMNMDMRCCLQNLLSPPSFPQRLPPSTRMGRLVGHSSSQVTAPCQVKHGRQ